MTRIFEVVTICPASERGRPPINSVYKVSAHDAEKAIAIIKKKENYSNLEKVMSVVRLASTE